MGPIKRRRQRNTHFTFKRFHIDQKDCAMKVSSDSCIFGAYVPVDSARRILDIGTGTGVLALMAAQRAAPSTIIDGVEICSQAAETARRNVAASPFVPMVRIFEGRIQTFVPEGGMEYDLILSNPPFFQKALPNQHRARTIARHASGEGMDFPDLVASACRLLASNGQLWLLLPPLEMAIFAKLAAETQLFEWERLALQHKHAGPPNRLISCFGRFPKPLKKSLLVRCLEDGITPSPEVRSLLRDYMLSY
jgi:tRNA1Val (adenine37-N6)-methyltransferase